LKSKIGSKEHENRLKLFIWIGSFIENSGLWEEAVYGMISGIKRNFGELENG